MDIYDIRKQLRKQSSEIVVETCYFDKEDNNQGMNHISMNIEDYGLEPLPVFPGSFIKFIHLSTSNFTLIWVIFLHFFVCSGV